MILYACKTDETGLRKEIRNGHGQARVGVMCPVTVSY